MSIRAATEADVPAMLSIYDGFVRNTAVSFEYETPSRAEFTLRLREHIAVYPWLGYAYAGRAFERAAYAWNAEISCYLAACARRRGIGRELYGRIEEILRRMGVRKVFAVVTSANAPSVAFHHALGYHDAARFSDVGFKHGAWYDVLWLEKQLSPLGMPEAFPTPWK